MYKNRFKTAAISLLTAACILLSLAGCGPLAHARPTYKNVAFGSGAEIPGARERFTVLNGDGSDRATVMLYMTASDLENECGAATSDIEEILAAGTSDSIDVVFQTGGCLDWESDSLTDGMTERFHAENGKLVRDGEPVEADMLDPETLSSFIKWAAESYPASRYILILWDHGGGVLDGFGYDEIYPESTLDITALAGALKDGGVKFDVVGFDACFMATLETAFALEPYADYLLSSEESEPAEGWEYTEWLRMLAEDPSADTVSLCERLISGFVKPSVEEGDMRTLSLTELRNIPLVVERLTELIGGSGGEGTPDHAALAAAREGTTEFGGNYYDQIDLYGFAEKFDSPAAARLKEAVSAAVVISGCNFLGANGLSFYFPFRYPYAYESNALGTLKTLGFPAGYTDRLKEFARDIAETASGGIRPSAWYDPDEEYTYTSEGTSTLKAEKTKNGETVVRFGLYDYMTAEDVIMHLSVFDGESWIELGRDCMYEFNDDGDLVYDEDPYWMTLDGLLVPFTVLCDRENGNGDLYSYGRVRMLLNGEEDVDLIVYWDNTYCGGYVAGYRYTEGKKEELYALRPGDILEAVVDSYTPEGKYEGEYIWGDPIIITDGRVEVDYEPIDYFDVRVSYRVIFRDGHSEQTEEVTFDARYDLLYDDA